MIIENCTLADSEIIQQTYHYARQLQEQKQMVVWPVFSDVLVENAIREKRQWKIVVDNRLACSWAVTFNDKEIWQERDQNDAIYIHRIATHPEFRGRRFVDTIVFWSKNYARSVGRRYIRLDTIGNNEGLIRHYEAAGFRFLGATPLLEAEGLPAHYQVGAICCRFELEA